VFICICTPENSSVKLFSNEAPSDIEMDTPNEDAAESDPPPAKRTKKNLKGDATPKASKSKGKAKAIPAGAASKTNPGKDKKDVANVKANAISNYTNLLGQPFTDANSEMRMVNAGGNVSKWVPLVSLPFASTKPLSLSYLNKAYSEDSEHSLSLRTVFTICPTDLVSLVIKGKSELEMMLALGKWLNETYENQPQLQQRTKELKEYIEANEPHSRDGKLSLAATYKAMQDMVSARDDGVQVGRTRKRKAAA